MGSNQVADHRRLKLLPPKVNRSACFDASRGCLVLANMQGLTDVLYLGMKLCPVFVFPAADGSPVAYSLLGALARAAAESPPRLETPSCGARKGSEPCLDSVVQSIVFTGAATLSEIRTPYKTTIPAKRIAAAVQWCGSSAKAKPAGDLAGCSCRPEWMSPGLVVFVFHEYLRQKQQIFAVPSPDSSDSLSQHEPT
eukprot:Skav209806  [mRNA]  locus=scaffold2415:13040:24261:+ [translate_table: standard]